MKSNEAILQRVQAVFSQSKVKFIYFCGSRAYGTEDKDSDIDITVVLDGFRGNLHLQVDDLDVFAYGTDTFLLKQQFNEAIPLYFLAHVDDILTIDSNLIYLDETYREDYETYKQVDFQKNLPTFLHCFTQYHHYRLCDNVPKKTHYHILRMRGMLDHLDHSGCFEQVVDEPWRTRMMDYKKTWETKGHEWMSLIHEQWKYIREYKGKVIQRELG